MAEAQPIIGLVGHAGSGKDTAAALFARYCTRTPQILSFAAPLKAGFMTMVGRTYHIDPECVYGASELRDQQIGNLTRNDGLPLTVRHMLQTLGTGWGRGCRESLWADIALQSAANAVALGRVVIISDCRFINEMRAIRDAGGYVVRIEREGAGLTGDGALHPSEREMDTPEARALTTRTLDNNGTLTELEQHVAAMVVTLGLA